MLELLIGEDENYSILMLAVRNWFGKEWGTVIKTTQFNIFKFHWLWCDCKFQNKPN